MTKGMYHQLRQAWKKSTPELLKQRLIDWRASDAVVKLDKPTRIDRARALGYKDKKGFLVVRVRLLRGGRKKSRPKKARRSKRLTIRLTLKINYQFVAEQRAQRKFTNLEVLNSYQVGKDGQHYFYEIIMVDPERPEIKNDRTMSWITTPANRNRVYKGLTSAAKKSRGLRHKSHELKIRPSLRAQSRKGK